MEATTSKTMQLVASMMEKSHVQVPDLEVVGKSHDDQFLRRALPCTAAKPPSR